jgi:cytochrome bd-type quinol oxidase subunit 2
MNRLDVRTLALILVATAIGATWAAISLASTDGARNDQTVRPLVWVIVATPAFIFGGWAIARRAELGMAAFTCLAIYLFAPFVAARIETIVAPGAPGHTPYFVGAIVLHAIAGVVIAIWRALAPERATSMRGAEEGA